MKAMCLIAFLTFGATVLEAQTSPEPAWPDLSLSVSLEDASMFELLQHLEQHYPLRFYYKEEWLSRDKRDWSLSAVPVQQALQEILAEDGLDALPLNEYMVMLGRPLELQRFAEARKLPTSEQATENPVLFQAKTRKNVIGDSTLRPLPTQATVSGAIFDPDSDEGLMGVTVAFPDLQKGDLTDSTGTFSVTIPTGAHKVLLRSSGRETREEILYIYSDGVWETDLAYTAFQLDEVLLEASGEEANVNSIETGLVRLSPMDIRKMPNLLGEIDIVNSVMMVPGVSSVGEAARGFNVRGGNIDQNLVMQEGSIILNSSHLLGFYSLFHPDLVKEVNLYKGHIPAQFGGRISSVLDVKLDEGSYRKLRGRATIGAVSSKVSVGGPIVKNQTSFLLGIRTAYPKLLMNTQQTRPNISNSDAFYGDITAKISQKLGEYGTLSANTYLSTDRFKFAEGFGFNWQNAMGGLEWKQIYHRQLSSTVKVNASQYRSNLTQEPLGAESVIKSGMDQLRFKAGILFTPPRHTIHAGIDGVNYQVTPNSISPFADQSAIEQRIVEKDQGLELGLYANDEIKISSFLSLSLGLRLSQFLNYGPATIYQYGESSVPILTNLSDSVNLASGEVAESFTGLEPRISLRVNVDENTSVKLGYNRMYQYLHLLSNSAAATPVDLWQLSNTYFPAQSAHNYFFGIYRNFRSNTVQASLEFYYRDLEGQVVNRNFAQLLVNQRIETEVFPAEGRAYGGEFSLNFQIRKWEVKSAYVYSRSLQRTPLLPDIAVVNGGNWFPSDFDSPHNITLTAIWKAKKSITYSVNFVYRTGRPVSVPVGFYPIFPSFQVPAFSERNQFRIPDYHRLDIAATFDRQVIKRSRSKSEFVLSLYNLYGRNNPFSVYFQRGGGGFEAYQLSVLGAALPMLSYNFRF